jgi:hypothetical protein
MHDLNGCDVRRAIAVKSFGVLATKKHICLTEKNSIAADTAGVSVRSVYNYKKHIDDHGTFLSRDARGRGHERMLLNDQELKMKIS